MTEKSTSLSIHSQSRTVLEILGLATLTQNKDKIYLDLIRTISDLTPAKCIREGMQVINLKHADPDKLETLLIEAITFVNLTSNVSKKMNNFQVQDATVTIIKEYWFLKVEEIVLALNNWRTGKYGEIYRIDITSLCVGIDSYINQERDGAAEEIQTRPEPPQRELISDEKAKEYREQFDKLMLQVQSKKQAEKAPVLDENYLLNTLRNNLPFLTLEELNEWEVTFKKSDDLVFMQLVIDEIAHRLNRAK